MSTPRAQARLRYLLSSPPKVRQVCGLIQGLEIEPARQQLELTSRGASTEVLKLLDSAVANADHAVHIPEDELFVERAVVDEGPTLRRWRPRARGRATRVRKRTSHVLIVVARLPDDELERRRRRDAERGRMTPRRRPRVRRRRAEEEEHDHEHEGEEATAAEDAVAIDDVEEPVGGSERAEASEAGRPGRSGPPAPAEPQEEEEEDYEEPDLSAVPDFEDIQDGDEDKK
ncbi:MAG: 50S ribosomal protein L22 [Acidimicrobiia bacterium]